MPTLMNEYKKARRQYKQQQIIALVKELYIFALIYGAGTTVITLLLTGGLK